MGDAEMINELRRLGNVVTSLAAVVVELQASNVSLIAMIAEQVASNINLANMIAQQILTNAALADSITELQNQVTLQTATNVNLANMITELQTQVATLAAITAQLVTVNIRALDEQDQANQPLPYDDISMDTTITPINNGAQGTFTWADGVDWPAGDDFYISAIQFLIVGGAEYLKKYEDQIFVYIDDGAGGPGEYYFSKSYTGLNTHVGNNVALGWIIGKTYYLSQLRMIDVSLGQAIRIFVHNASGIALSVEIYISGITRTP